jgi:rubrerythrin
MAKLKGSQTEKNLLAAFAGESQARNRYTMAAKVAKREGFDQIGGIFLETAENELEHAKLFFKLLEGGETSIAAGYPAGVKGDTLVHLKAAAAGEKVEWTTLYTGFVEVAGQEGFKDAARVFGEVAEVEKWHERRYNKLIEALEAETVFQRPAKVLWKCRNCGRVLEASSAPAKCPTCDHPQAYFEIFTENY